MLLAILLQTTTPATIGPLGVLVVFVLLYVAALAIATFLIHHGSHWLAKASRAVTVKRPLTPLGFTRSYYFASILALVPVMLIGMQSVGEIGLYDLLLVVAFAVIACFYVAKQTV